MKTVIITAQMSENSNKRDTPERRVSVFISPEQNALNGKARTIISKKITQEIKIEEIRAADEKRAKDPN